MARQQLVTRRSSVGRLRRRLGRLDPWSLVALPGIVVLLGFFGSALGFVVHRSLTDPGSENYRQVTDAFYRSIFVTTFRNGLLITLVVLAMGYAFAFAMTVGPKVLRYLLIGILVVQFSTSWLARAFAWQQILQTNGVVNRALQNLGLIDEPLKLMRNDFGMVVGTAHVLLPFMVLTLYANMKQVDLSTLVAAQSLGARRSTAFLKVFVPATRTGIVAGCGLVFVLSLGFYITPMLLGDPSRLLVSAMVVQMANQHGDFGGAAALSIVLLVVTLVGIFLTSVAGRVLSRRGGDIS